MKKVFDIRLYSKILASNSDSFYSQSSSHPDYQKPCISDRGCPLGRVLGWILETYLNISELVVLRCGQDHLTFWLLQRLSESSPGSLLIVAHCSNYINIGRWQLYINKIYWRFCPSIVNLVALGWVYLWKYQRNSVWADDLFERIIIFQSLLLLLLELLLIQNAFICLFLLLVSLQKEHTDTLPCTHAPHK